MFGVTYQSQCLPCLGARVPLQQTYGYPVEFHSFSAAQLTARRLHRGMPVPLTVAQRTCEKMVEVYSGKLMVVAGEYVDNPLPPTIYNRKLSHAELSPLLARLAANNGR